MPVTPSACAVKKLTSRRSWSLDVGVCNRNTTMPAYSSGASWVGEIEVEGHETALPGLHRDGNVGVGASGESLLVHRGHVVAPSSQSVSRVAVDVFVELDLHEVSTTGRIRSDKQAQ